MLMFYALMALCLPGSILAQVVTSGGCPDVQVQENFDMSKFAGRWYQQARFYASFQTDTECPIFDYVIGANNTVIGISIGISTLTGVERKFEEEILTPDLKEPAKLLIDIPLSPVEGYNNLLVLGTDYDNWGVLFCCTVVRDRNVQYAWILSRVQVPDGSALASVNALLLKNKIDTSLFEMIDQESCPK